MRPPPRLFGICATAADVVAVVRRGPSDWTHIGSWDLASEQFHSGSWLRARVYQQRCDVSPDGRYLCYLALNGGAEWSAGQTYIAVSRLPWVTALAAWGMPGTYSWGAHFVDDRAHWGLPDPDEGEDGPLKGRYGMALTQPRDFAVERRRGWIDLPSLAPPTGKTRRARRADSYVVGRPRPGQPARREHDLWLAAIGEYAAFRSGDETHRHPAYELRDGATGPALMSLEDVQWADWARDGRLLVATTDGRLQIRDATSAAVQWEHSLADLTPTPQRPPREARQW